MKCRWCGKDFEPRDHRVFCSPDCRYRHDVAKSFIVKKVNRIAEKNGFNITGNKMKIIEAKLMLFRGKELIKCPCAAQDEERYCGSPKCIQEVKEKGICHCHLFEAKND